MAGAALGGEEGGDAELGGEVVEGFDVVEPFSTVDEEVDVFGA